MKLQKNLKKSLFSDQRNQLSCIVGGLGFLVLVLASASFAAVNYDTAWTFVYDGGKDSASGDIYQDKFFDVKCLPNGECVCVGYSGFSNTQSLVIKLDKDGNVLKKKTYNTSNSYARYNSQSAHAIAIAKNGDYIIGGIRFAGPLVMRLDSQFNLKWSSWYYDSTKALSGSLLLGSGTINSICETKRGTIITAVGDEYPYNGGQALSNYAACLEFAADGAIAKGNEWSAITGYKIGGFSIDETSTGYYLLAGNQAVFYLDTNGVLVWKNKYTFWLEGVGTVTNNISRAKMLRDGSLMVTGVAYEGNCWNRYQQFYYDAWHTPISYAYGANASWDTAGSQGSSDAVYDFTQLINGNLVFVGTNGDYFKSGVWAFVTDSTGKNLLWEKTFNIPYKTEDGRGPRPLSVCATADTGFTVAGDYVCLDANGGVNAFAAHFIPKESSSAQFTHTEKKQQILNVKTTITSSQVVFNFTEKSNTFTKIEIYNAAGKVVDRLVASESLTGSFVTWNIAAIPKGVYWYKLTGRTKSCFGQVVIK